MPARSAARAPLASPGLFKSLPEKEIFRHGQLKQTSNMRGKILKLDHESRVDNL
jgi:hypothetical protein